MGERTVARRPRSGIAAQFRQFLVFGGEAKALADRANEIKSQLMLFAEENGLADEKGHQIFSLDSPVEVGKVKFRGFMRQRRVSQTFDEDAAEALAKSKGLKEDDYIETIKVVSQDKIARLYAEDVITEEEFDSLLSENITWAFVPIKGAE